jgi:hypothetical protein
VCSSSGSDLRHARPSPRSLLPGALTAAVLWQDPQLVGTAYVDHVVQGTDVAYGVSPSCSA